VNEPSKPWAPWWLIAPILVTPIAATAGAIAFGLAGIAGLFGVIALFVMSIGWPMLTALACLFGVVGGVVPRWSPATLLIRGWIVGLPYLLLMWPLLGIFVMTRW
jgi:hypothetical protein